MPGFFYFKTHQAGLAVGCIDNSYFAKVSLFVSGYGSFVFGFRVYDNFAYIFVYVCSAFLQQSLGLCDGENNIKVQLLFAIY